MSASIHLADVAVHGAFGTMFACTGACARHFCRHTIAKLAVGAALIAVEATVMVAVAG